MNDTYDDRPDETRWQIAGGLAIECVAQIIICLLAVSGWMMRTLNRFLSRV